MKLYEIQDKFDELVEQYMDNPHRGTGSEDEKVMLSDMNDEFAYLMKELRRHCKEIWGRRTSRDDKACSAKKARIALKLHKEGHPDVEDGKPLSWNKAEEVAGGTDEYEEFLEERIQNYEDWDSAETLRNTIKQYMINLGGRLSAYQ